MSPKEFTVAMTTSETNEQLREQLRVGVRMLEALDVQLRAAEAVIAREEDVRTRITTALDRLEETAARLRETVVTTARSGSLEASPPKKDPAAVAQMLRTLADDLITQSQRGITVHTPVEIDATGSR